VVHERPPKRKPEWFFLSAGDLSIYWPAARGLRKEIHSGGSVDCCQASRPRDARLRKGDAGVVRDALNILNQQPRRALWSVG
jgi:hypothetical protein